MENQNIRYKKDSRKMREAETSLHTEVDEMRHDLRKLSSRQTPGTVVPLLARCLRHILFCYKHFEQTRISRTVYSKHTLKVLIYLTFRIILLTQI